MDLKTFTNKYRLYIILFFHYGEFPNLHKNIESNIVKFDVYIKQL